MKNISDMSLVIGMKERLRKYLGMIQLREQVGFCLYYTKKELRLREEEIIDGFMLRVVKYVVEFWEVDILK